MQAQRFSILDVGSPHLPRPTPPAQRRSVLLPNLAEESSTDAGGGAAPHSTGTNAPHLSYEAAVAHDSRLSQAQGASAWRRSASRLLAWRWTSLLLLAMTVYVIFERDLRQAAISPAFDPALDIITLACLSIFALEIGEPPAALMLYYHATLPASKHSILHTPNQPRCWSPPSHFGTAVLPCAAASCCPPPCPLQRCPR